jgi:nucleotide-binding universal stress UspA family protein
VKDHGPLAPAEYLEEMAAYPRPVPVATIANSETYPVDAIATIARDTEDSIVCMTSHGRGGLRWGLLGSVAEDVVRRAERPTFLVGRHCREDFLTDAHFLLTGVDGTETSSQLAPVVCEWAKRLGLELRAAIVVHPLDVERAEHPEALLDPIVEQFGGPDRATATLLTSRYPEGTLADYAGDIGAGAPRWASCIKRHARFWLPRGAGRKRECRDLPCGLRSREAAAGHVASTRPRAPAPDSVEPR